MNAACERCGGRGWIIVNEGDRSSTPPCPVCGIADEFDPDGGHVDPERAQAAAEYRGRR